MGKVYFYPWQAFEALQQLQTEVWRDAFLLWQWELGAHKVTYILALFATPWSANYPGDHSRASIPDQIIWPPLIMGLVTSTQRNCASKGSRQRALSLSMRPAPLS